MRVDFASNTVWMEGDDRRPLIVVLPSGKERIIYLDGTVRKNDQVGK